MRNESEAVIKKHMFESRLKTMEQIEQLLDMIFQDREQLDYEVFSHIIQNESSDLLVNMLQVIRDCLPCTQTFYENMNEFYQGEQMGSTSRHVPLPRFNPQMDKSETLSKAGGGKTGAGMLSGYSKGETPASGAPKEEGKSAFEDLDFEENIKFMADGFAKNEEKIDQMKEKMYEPGSPKISTSGVRV